MNAGRVLVIVGDDWVARLLATQLRSYEFEASSCASGTVAVVVATALQPDCIIVSAVLPELDGIGVVRAIRSEPEPLSNVPIVIIADDNDARTQAFRAGADAYICAPYRTEDVVLQAQALINLAQRFAGTPPVRSQRPAEIAAHRDSVMPGTPAIEGNLSQMSVATVLTLLEMERRSGYFKVVSNNRRCTIELVAGHAVSATMDRKKTEPLTVLREVLRWSEGRFHFKPGVDEPVPASRASIGALLLEAVRLDDEQARDGAVDDFAQPRVSWPSATTRRLTMTDSGAPNRSLNTTTPLKPPWTTDSRSNPASPISPISPVSRKPSGPSGVAAPVLKSPRTRGPGKPRS